jgi:hypothetical protein
MLAGDGSDTGMPSKRLTEDGSDTAMPPNKAQRGLTLTNMDADLRIFMGEVVWKDMKTPEQTWLMKHGRVDDSQNLKLAPGIVDALAASIERRDAVAQGQINRKDMPIVEYERDRRGKRAQLTAQLSRDHVDDLAAGTEHQAAVICSANGYWTNDKHITAGVARHIHGDDAEAKALLSFESGLARLV